MSRHTVAELIPVSAVTAYASVEGITPERFAETAANFWTGIYYDLIAKHGAKLASNLVETLYTASSTNYLNQLAFVVRGRCLDKWTKELAALEAEYDPLANVDATETETHSGTDSHNRTKDLTRTDNLTDELTHGHQLQRTNANTDTRTHNNTDALTHGLSSTITHNVSGDNSGSVVSGSDVTTNSGTDSTAHSGTIADAHTGTITDANSGKDTTTHTGTQKDGGTDNLQDVHGHVITTRKLGNIGVTSSMELVRQELDLRSQFVYFDMVVDDLAKIFASFEWSAYDD